MESSNHADQLKVTLGFDGKKLYYTSVLASTEFFYTYDTTTKLTTSMRTYPVLPSATHCSIRKGNPFCVVFSANSNGYLVRYMGNPLTLDQTLMSINGLGGSVPNMLAKCYNMVYNSVQDTYYCVSTNYLLKIENPDGDEVGNFKSTTFPKLDFNNEGGFAISPITGEFVVGAPSCIAYKFSATGTNPTQIFSLNKYGCSISAFIFNSKGELFIYYHDKTAQNIPAQYVVKGSLNGGSFWTVSTILDESYWLRALTYPSVSSSNTYYTISNNGIYSNTIDYVCIDKRLTGTNCEIPLVYCYGIAFNNASVCSGHGNCVTESNCSCSAGYTGMECEIGTCLGVLHHPGECSGRGSCIDFNNCTCDYGYGDNCHLDMCFDILSDNSSVCSGNGVCTGPDTCFCNDGFAGPTCNYTIGSDFYWKVSNYSLSFPSTKFYSNGTHLIYHDQQSLKIKAISFQTRQVSTIAVFTLSTIVEYQYFNGSLFFFDLSNSFRVLINGSVRRLGTVAVGKQYLSNSGQYSTFKDGTVQTFHVCSSGILFVEANTGKMFLMAFMKLETNSYFFHIAGKGYVESSNSWNFNNGNGNAGDATFGYISSITSNSNGDVFLMDTKNHAIRKFNLFIQKMSTVAGIGGNSGYSGDGLTASTSLLKLTQDCKLINFNGDLLFYDSGNSIIRKVSNGKLITIAGKQGSTGNATIGSEATKTSLSISLLFKTSQGDLVFKETSGSYKALSASLKCAEGFMGDKCDLPLKCGGVSFLDSNVCSKRGNCLATGMCECNEGYTGESCEISQCYGVPSNNPTVCNGNGKCIDTDTCQCKSGFYNNKCTGFSCFGIDKSNTAVCSSHGACISPNQCLCASDSNNGFWSGANCSSCMSPYIGSKCNTFPDTGGQCVASITCFGRGTCVKQACVCSGNFKGAHCDSCKSGFYGRQCNVYCENKVTCSGNGYCDSILGGACTCYSDSTRGFFTGIHCDKCQDGYYGTKCLTQIIGKPILTDGGDGLTIIIKGSYDYQNIPCDRVFVTSISENTNFGINPKCYWKNKKTGEFIVEFGDGFSVYPLESSISFRSDMLDAVSSSFPTILTMKIGNALNPFKPVAKIQKKRQLYGICDYLLLDGTSSFSGDRKPLTFYWSLVSSTNETESMSFNDTLTNRTSYERFSIPEDSFPLGIHTISLIVQSTYGVQSDPDFLTITKLNTGVPTVSLPTNINLFYRNKNNDFHTFHVLSFSPCIPNDTPTTITWSALENPSSHQLFFQQVFNKMHIVYFSLPPGPQHFVIEVKAALVSDPTIYSTANATYYVIERDLSLKMKVKSVSYSSAVIESYFDDPENSTQTQLWTYSCATAEGDSCGKDISAQLSKIKTVQKSLQLSRDLFNSTMCNMGTRFYISSQVVMGTRQAKHQVVVTFATIPNALPLIITNIFKPYRNPNRGETFNLRNEVTVYGKKIDCKTEKNPNGAVMNWYLDGKLAQFNHGDNLTVLAEEGKTYNAEFRTSYNSSEAWEITTITVNRAPTCKCSVSPNTGIAMDTIFTISCPNCQNMQESLEVTYGFIDYKTQVQVAMHKGDFIFQTALPAHDSPQRGVTYELYVKLFDTLTEGKNVQKYSVTLYNPLMLTLSEVTDKVIEWQTKYASLPIGDPGLVVYSRVSMVNAVNYALRIIDPVSNTRSLRAGSRTRTVDCSGHGQLVNGTCICDSGYFTTDCKYTAKDMEAIKTMKEGLFDDFINENLRRNSTFDPITDDILTSIILGINPFLSDTQYRTNNTFEKSLLLLTLSIDEALSDNSFTISQELAQSCVSLLEIIYQSEFKDNYRSIIYSYYEKIGKIRLRSMNPGDRAQFSDFTFTSAISTMELASSINGGTFYFSDAISNMFVKFPETFISSYDEFNIPQIVFTTDILNNVTSISQTIKDKDTEYSSSVISQYGAYLKIDVQNPITYHIPLIEPLQNTNTRPSRLRKLIQSPQAYYSCVAIEEDQISQDVKCDISFISDNTQEVECVCSQSTTVIVVKSEKEIQIEDGLIYCADIESSNPNVCSGNGNCIDSEVCECSENYYGSTCQFEYSNDNSTNSTDSDNSTMSNSTKIDNSTMAENSTWHDNSTNNSTTSSNSTIENNSTISDNSTMSNSTDIDNSTMAENSTWHDNSTMDNSTIFDNSSMIDNSTLGNFTFNNETFSNTSILNETQVDNSTLDGSNSTTTDNSTTDFDNSTFNSTNLESNSTDSVDNSTINSNITETTTFDNETSTDNNTVDLMSLELIASSLVADYCDLITITVNTDETYSFKWSTTNSNAILIEQLEGTTTKEVTIDTSLIGPGQFNFSVTISEKSQHITKSISINVKNIEPIVQLDDYSEVSVGSFVDLIPSITLPSCYPLSTLVFTYKMDTSKNSSVEEITKFEVDENGILSLGPSSITKEGVYNIIFGMEGQFIEPIKMEITFRGTLDPLSIQFNVSSEITLMVGSCLDFQIQTFDPNGVAENETLEISCTNSNGTCTDIYYPISSVYSSVLLHEGVYNFTAIYTKGSRSVSSCIIVTVTSSTPTDIEPPVIEPPTTYYVFVSNIVFASNVDSNNVDPNTDLKISFSTIENLANPQYTWSSDDIILSNPSSDFILIPKELLTPNAKHQISLQITDGIKFSKAETHFTVNSAPTIGNFVISPKEGKAIETVFTLDASEGWNDENLPLTFKFFYLDEFENNWISLSDHQSSSSSAISTLLSPGYANSTLRVKVMVYDSYGIYSFKESSVIVKKPQEITDSIMSIINNINATVSSPTLLTAALNVIGSVNETTDMVIHLTNSLVSTYVERFNVTNVNSENVISTISVYSYSSNCLNMLQDSVTSNLIYQLEMLTEAISSLTFTDLDEFYLDSVKYITDKLYEKVVSQKSRALSTRELKSLENIYSNLVRAYVKRSTPNTNGKLINTNSISTYSRKINTLSAKSSIITSEIIDSNNTVLSLSSNIALHPRVSSLPTFTILVKSQSASYSSSIISNIITISIPELPEGISSTQPIGLISLKLNSLSNNVSCVCLNSNSNTFERDSTCCGPDSSTQKTFTSTLSIYLYKTSTTFALWDESKPVEEIIEPEPETSDDNNDNDDNDGNNQQQPTLKETTQPSYDLGYLSLLTLLATVGVVGIMTAAIVWIWVKRKRLVSESEIVR